MDTQTHKQFLEQLGSGDHRACDEAAAKILERGEVMIDPLLELQGDGRWYAGWLGNRRGSMLVTLPMPGFPLTPEQQEKVVTVEVAALYLVEAIHRKRLDFASSALLTDLSLPEAQRRAANKKDYVTRGFEAARRWSDEVKRDGIEALRAAGNNPLRSARLAFW